MSRIVGWTRSHRMHTATIMIVAFAIGLAGALGVARATDSPGFCRAACHEMGPYHDAWASGGHRDVSCVECHVDPGALARITHKAEAAKEVWAHFATDPAFPLPDQTSVPDERCIRCHEDVNVTDRGFAHSDHARRGPCQSCHADIGHKVTVSALRDAGVLNADVDRRVLSGRVATVDEGSANIDGHVLEPCSRCHDMAKTTCAACHEPAHGDAGPAAKNAACDTCHAAGERFAFAHPAATGSTRDCAACHIVPAEHAYRGPCSTCHTQTGVKWSFAHNKTADCTSCHKPPANHRKGPCTGCHESGTSWAFSHPRSGSCTSCHSRPRGHRAGSCTTCHATGRSWAFSHPASKSCTTCHARPSGHKSGSCTTCHRTGTSWAFRHPGARSGCTSCHSRPGGHRSGSCTSCHSTSSWGFRHPGSSACSSCHKAPGGHYGSSCSSCHKTGRSWSSASFSHPRVPGGEHSYRSFSCGSCHPSGYGSHSCRKCHDSNNPGDGDGDDD